LVVAGLHGSVRNPFTGVTSLFGFCRFED